MSDFPSAADSSLPSATIAANPKIMIALLWAVVVCSLAAPAIKDGVFDAMSTDDAMRLVEVRDLIAGQGWFDLMQHRLDPPGVSMHWSRVIDAPLAALIVMLRPLTGAAGAEAVTLILWPALLFGAALLLVAAIARAISEGPRQLPVQLAAVFLAALSAPALIHFRAGAIDHHNAQLVLLLALAFLLGEVERSVVKACLAGLAATLSLSIGLEMLPAIAAACVAVFGLLVWRGRAVAFPIEVFGAALAGSSLLLAGLLLPPHSLGAPVCDAFGGPSLLLIAGGGVSLMIVADMARRHFSLPARAAAGAVAGSILLGSFFGLFPGCLASPYAAVDPILKTFWLDNVAEAMSLQTMLQLAPQKIPGFYGFPVLTLGLAVAALYRAAPPGRFRWILATVTLGTLIGISLWEMRGAAAATIMAAPFLAASLAALWPGREPGRALVFAALVASPASFAGLGLAAQPLIEAIAKPQMKMVNANPATSCLTASSLAPLAHLAPGRVMAPIDLGPAILAATGHTVIAAPYHRNNDGNLAMLSAFLAPPQNARQILSGRDVDYVVLCSAAAEQTDFVKMAPDGLAARLGRGETPDFLERLDLDPTRKLSVWRVRPDK
jgi:hypothetical protein